MVFLEVYGYAYYGGIGNLLNVMADAGFFDYVLPFLFVFAIIFGILTSMNIFRNNRGVNAIIAFAIALMALQFGIVSDFFEQVFPRLGIALAIMLVLLILAGFFIDPKSSGGMWFLVGIGLVFTIVVVINSFQNVGWYYSTWLVSLDFLGLIAIVVVVIIALVVVVAATNRMENYDWQPWHPITSRS